MTALDNADFFGYVDATDLSFRKRLASGLFIMVSDRTYYVILGGAVLWCAAIVVAPLCASESGLVGSLGSGLYLFFHPICHQLDDRSFHIFGKPLAVCIRCLAIYGGFLVGVVLYAGIGRRARGILSFRAILLWSVVPMLLDVVLDAIDVHQSTTLTRCITGLLFGVVIPFTIIPAAQEGVRELLSPALRFLPSEATKGQSHA